MIVVQLPQAMFDNRFDEWPVVLSAVEYQVGRAFGNTFTNVEVLEPPGPRLAVLRRRKNGDEQRLDIMRDVVGRRVAEIVEGISARQAERSWQR